ncbi:alpha/beta hydrolase fold domain-containing protein [Streptomyces sp. NPDC059787]|uniref:alpha/beta hydrolase n=1 Tax=Streptomyces sp. NPDC059787 TaxID=3346947 RepID=UPI00364E11A5
MGPIRTLPADIAGRAPGGIDKAVTVEDHCVPGPHGPVPVRSYRPAAPPRTGLLWMHGGGFRAGSLDMPEAHDVSLALAARAQALVVSVDYQLASTDVVYPMPLDDVYAAWRWLCEDPGHGHLAVRAVGGASAGGALALGAAIRGRDDGLPAHQLLLAYPFAHYPNPALDEATMLALARMPEMPRFPPALVESMVADYVGRITDVPQLALPGAARLDALPATALLLAQYDDLRPSGELLHRQLDSVGVPVTALVALGAPHGHLNADADAPMVVDSLRFLARALTGPDWKAKVTP